MTKAQSGDAIPSARDEVVHGQHHHQARHDLHYLSRHLSGLPLGKPNTNTGSQGQFNRMFKRKTGHHPKTIAVLFAISLATTQKKRTLKHRRTQEDVRKLGCPSCFGG